LRRKFQLVIKTKGASIGQSPSDAPLFAVLRVERQIRIGMMM
jgi:hypothetical protein